MLVGRKPQNKKKIEKKLSENQLFSIKSMGKL